MKRTPQRNTPAEMVIRKEAHRRGLRYRVDKQAAEHIRSRPDMLFIGARIAVYVDGCFWHGCPEHGTWPKNNAEFWRRKIEANIARDRAATKALEEAGWKVIRIWEHEAVPTAVDRIEAAAKGDR